METNPRIEVENLFKTKIAEINGFYHSFKLTPETIRIMNWFEDFAKKRPDEKSQERLLLKEIKKERARLLKEWINTTQPESVLFKTIFYQKIAEAEALAQILYLFS